MYKPCISEIDAPHQDEEGQCLYDVIVVARRDTLNASVAVIKEACPCTPLVYDMVDVHFVREARNVLSANSTKVEWAFNSTRAAWLTEWMDTVGSELEPAGNKTTLTYVLGCNDAWLSTRTTLCVEFVYMVYVHSQSRDLELGLVDLSDVIVVVSEVEREIIRHYRPKATVRT